MRDNIQELLKVRYKVIADYPGSVFDIGKILDDEILIESMSKYPHLFRKLEWWEERSPKDMPEYLKYQSGHVEKVSRYDFSDDTIYLSIKAREAPLSLKYLVSRTIPATATDYLNQTPKP